MPDQGKNNEPGKRGRGGGWEEGAVGDRPHPPPRGGRSLCRLFFHLHLLFLFIFVRFFQALFFGVRPENWRLVELSTHDKKHAGGHPLCATVYLSSAAVGAACYAGQQIPAGFSWLPQRWGAGSGAFSGCLAFHLLSPSRQYFSSASCITSLVRPHGRRSSSRPCRSASTYLRKTYLR